MKGALRKEAPPFWGVPTHRASTGDCPFVCRLWRPAYGTLSQCILLIWGHTAFACAQLMQTKWWIAIGTFASNVSGIARHSTIARQSAPRSRCLVLAPTSTIQLTGLKSTSIAQATKSVAFRECEPTIRNAGGHRSGSASRLSCLCDNPVCTPILVRKQQKELVLTVSGLGLSPCSPFIEEYAYR